MSVMHVSHTFHQSGHGTFFTGALMSGHFGSTSPGYTWVYDCGSKRSSHLKTIVNNMAVTFPKSWKSHIDMLAISHFDDDHTNGLEELLSKHTVGRLTIPYASFERRLATALSLDGEKLLSRDTALFALDPVTYLVSKGLGERVQEIVLVTGNADSEDDGLDEFFPSDQRGPETEEGFVWREIPAYENESENFASGDGYNILGRAANLQVSTTSHDSPFVPNGYSWEFFFFNSAPSTCAGRSSAKIKAAIADAKDVIREMALLGGTHAIKPKWRDKLKKVYIRHFGHSSKSRNNISLCVLSAPTKRVIVESCAAFDRGHSLGYVSPNPIKKGLLLCGDLTIDSSMLRCMERHFTPQRWGDIDVMQIPHHGSKNSWELGNMALCAHRHSVLCVPDSSSMHPHKTVLNDLKGSHTHRADYKNFVQETFHFNI